MESTHLPSSSATPPNLGLIPPEQWAQALRPLPHRVRMRAINSAGDVDRATILVTELEFEDWERQDTLRSAISGASELEVELEPQTTRRHPATRMRPCQVNLRLAEAERDALGQAALMLGLRPATLARALVVRGTQRLLAAAGSADTQNPTAAE